MVGLKELYEKYLEKEKIDLCLMGFASWLNRLTDQLCVAGVACLWSGRISAENSFKLFTRRVGYVKEYAEGKGNI